MDQAPRPTAAELGISEVEYERILRDVQRRDPAAAAPAAPRPRRRSRWAPLTAIAVIAVVLLARPGSGAHKPEYTFLDTVAGKPVTYSSCRPVRVAIYPAGGPPNAEQLVREAVARLRTATGLDIVVTGVFGGYAPNWNFKAAPVSTDDPISVSWQDGDAIAELTDHIGGIGGSRVISGRDGSKHLGAGTIALSRGYFAQLYGDRDQGQELAIVLHEFGHVLGLGHVSSRHELMYPSITGLRSYGPGDLEGLRLLGHGPCA